MEVWKGRCGLLRPAGSPSDAFPCRGVFWRRDRNTLSLLPARRKAVQSPCKYRGSCMQLRISFGAECIFLYIGFYFAPEFVPKSISNNHHHHNTLLSQPAILSLEFRIHKAGFSPSAPSFRYPSTPRRSIRLLELASTRHHNSRAIHPCSSGLPTPRSVRPKLRAPHRDSTPILVVSYLTKLCSRPRMRKA